MNIKSLLLGSAAAAVAFTGAQAADAIVIAEPEPMEYVRICDAYGAGYFYIPGTETCLRVSGWVRYQVGTTDRDMSFTDPAGVQVPITAADIQAGNPTLDADTDGVPNGWVGGINGRANLSLGSGAATMRDRQWNKYTGAQINFDARSETEYGTLRGWVQLEAGPGHTNRSAATDIEITINRALIQLGGLWMGYADSLFSSSSNIGGSGLGNYGGFTFADTFGYHYEQRHQIGYQFSGSNGFWGGLSLEHDPSGAASLAAYNGQDYMPDVVGKVAWSQGWGGVWLAAAYDDSADGVGVRGGVQGNFGALTARLDGYYQSEAAVSYGRGARWAVQGTALYQINPTLGVAAGLEYRDDLVVGSGFINTLASAAGVAPVPAGTVMFGGGNAWAAQLGVNWQPVQNFQIGADVTHNREKLTYAGHTYKQDNTAFRLRFQRNF